MIGGVRLPGLPVASPVKLRIRDCRSSGWSIGCEGMSAMKMTFLGTGTSVGVPVIGCDCPVCQSPDSHNRRTRSSVVVRHGDTTILVDTGPDLREQALREGLTSVDAVIYTHAHLDHVVGFDELRAFCWRRAGGLPLYATGSCMETLRTMFGWAFEAANAKNGGYVRPDPLVIQGELPIGSLRVTPLPVEHGSVETIGLMFDDGAARLVYLPDVKRVPQATFELVRGVDALVVDALRPRDHPTHFTTDEALAFAKASGAKRTWLTHLGHENDHAALAAGLPEGVAVAYDGLTLNVVRD